MKRLRRWWKKRRFIRAVRKAKRVLQTVDRRMATMGMPTWKRQQIRRDIITSDKAWLDFASLMGE